MGASSEPVGGSRAVVHRGCNDMNRRRQAQSQVCNRCDHRGRRTTLALMNRARAPVLGTVLIALGTVLIASARGICGMRLGDRLALHDEAHGIDGHAGRTGKDREHSEPHEPSMGSAHGDLFWAGPAHRARTYPSTLPRTRIAIEPRAPAAGWSDRWGPACAKGGNRSGARSRDTRTDCDGERAPLDDVEYFSMRIDAWR